LQVHRSRTSQPPVTHVALVCLFALSLASPSFGQAAARRAPGLYATFNTARGKFIVQLFSKEAPKTVDNFVRLARGTKPFKDPLTGMLATRPLYDGILFFRVVPGFIIQTGDPANTGTGDVGFVIENESNGLKFDRPGRLSLAQVPGEEKSRSSQIFITLRAAPNLDRDHFLVFGQVVQGMAVVRAIGAGPVKGDTPIHPVALHGVTIEEVK
jgi:peptidyl-prolyl cis-trans isomerase A (cyclophilin A)